MAISDNVAIKVLSYNMNPIVVKTNVKEYIFAPASNGVPTFHPMSYSEIEYINSHTSAFRSGELTFEAEEQDKYYKALKIFDWTEILFNDVIKDIILNPTIEGLQRLIDVKDALTFQRIRGNMIFLINTGIYDVSQRVVEIINRRFKEISQNKLKTDIILTPKSVTTPTLEVDIVKEQNAEMQKQIQEMQEQMQKLAAQLLEKQNTQNNSAKPLANNKPKSTKTNKKT